ncbi:MAG: hypothetical protein J3T61_02580 [Candidatus Brocadiales bacterium]|nr:hypothetical protein [Candidatus Bathyanammoxibius sp.]
MKEKTPLSKYIYENLNLELLKKLKLHPVNNAAEIEAVVGISFLYDSFIRLKNPDVSDKEKRRVAKKINALYKIIPKAPPLKDVDIHSVIFKSFIDERGYYEEYQRLKEGYQRVKTTDTATADVKESVTNKILWDLKEGADFSPFNFTLPTDLEEKIHQLKNQDWDNLYKTRKSFNTRLLEIILGYSPGALRTRKSRQKSRIEEGSP